MESRKLERRGVETYETDEYGVCLRLVRVTRDVFFTGGDLKVQAGAVGRVGGDDRGHLHVDFERAENDALFVALDGGGRRQQIVRTLDVEDLR